MHRVTMVETMLPVTWMICEAMVSIRRSMEAISVEIVWLMLEISMRLMLSAVVI